MGSTTIVKGFINLFPILFSPPSSLSLAMSPTPSEESIEQDISQPDVKKVSCTLVLILAYQSLGVVYGDLSTAPLYVYKTTFPGKPGLCGDDEENHGVHCFFSTLPMGARRRDLANIVFGCGEDTISELGLLLSHCPWSY